MTEPESLLAGPRRFELTIALLDAGVDIERRVLVPEHYALAELHLVIQAAMGWADAHLHEFTADDGTRYGDPELEDLDYADESQTLVRDVLGRPGDALEYVYDFGDHWVHRVEFAAVHTDGDQVGPACIGGHGACPPEDCGGVSGYRELREALADPGSPDHEELAEWASRLIALPLDAHAFDVEAANDAVRALAGLERSQSPAPDALPAGSPARDEAWLAEAIASAGAGPAGEARHLLAEALGGIADGRAWGFADILAGQVRRSGTLAPPDLDDLMAWGFYPEEALLVAAAGVGQVAALLRGRALTPGAAAPRLAARATEALAERLREAAARLDAHPVAGPQRRLATICRAIGDEEPALAGIAFELEDWYALGGPLEESVSERRDLLRDPSADRIEPPVWSGIDLLMLGDGDRLAFARMAEEVAERTERAFGPGVGVAGVGARSAEALSTMLHEFAATFAGVEADPRSRGWLAVAGALRRLHERGREEEGAGGASPHGAFAYANLSLALAGYYVEGCVPVGGDGAPPPAVALAVVAAGLDPGALSRVRTELRAELAPDRFAGSVAAELDARLGDAEAVLRGSAAWGVPQRGEEASGGAHAEQCERVADLLWGIAFDPVPDAEVEGVAALAAWLATGYGHMAAGPPGRLVAPPPLAAIEALDWSGAALSRVAGELERAVGPVRNRRDRKRAAAGGPPALIARLSEAAARIS